MKRSKSSRDFARIILLVCLIGLISSALAHPDPVAPTGTGTINDPYLIASIANLHWIADQVNDSYNTFSGAYFLQTADIDASETKPSGCWEETGWIPIGNSASYFSGYYDGNGHIISDLYINSPAGYIGLFGYISGGTVTNLTMTNCQITGSIVVGGLAGTLVGTYEDNAEISNCSVSGNVIASGQQSVGGLVGENSGGTIKNCSSSCSVSGYYDFVGGLVGVNSAANYNYSIINSCKATGTVKGVFHVGGLVGYNAGNAYIQQCCAFDSVRGANPPDGYYVRYTGGLVGGNYTGRITDSYARSWVLGEDYVGGLVGYNDAGTVANCYSTGEVSGSSNVGGFTGGTTYSIGQSFYDSTTSHQKDTGKGTPKNTTEMKTLSTFFNNGWDFEIETANGTLDIWDMDLSGPYNDGYPFLAWQNGSTKLLSLPQGTIPSVGNGTAANPYQIASMANLTWVAVDTNNWDEHYIQTADINASETRNGSKWIFNGWMPVGKESKAFTGSYNGQGHIIDSLYISRSAGSYQGFFGYVACDSIRNLGVINVNIQGKDRVGALAGFNSGSVIDRCFSSGSISGKENVGGLIGLHYLNVVNNSYSTASASGTSKVGGLIGRNENATLNYCYSTGNISAGEYTGGLVGRNYSSTAENCFWDTETSGKTNSQGGTGKTTAEMKTQTTFTTAGWDFTKTWAMATTFNSGYPYLQWQYTQPAVVRLSLNATQFDFGQVTIGQSSFLPLTLYCPGDDTLFITSIESSNTKFVTSIHRATLPAGTGITDTLWYYPDVTGADSGYIVITSNAVSSPDTIKVKGAGIPVSGIATGSVPCKFGLSQNYPNPFNPTTTIAFALAKEAAVTLNIYDLTGREVAVLADNESLKAGNYTRIWNAAQMPTGVYLCRIQAGDFSAVKKLVLIK